VAFGGRVFDETAYRRENVGKRDARRHHLQESLLAGELDLRPVSLIDIPSDGPPSFTATDDPAEIVLHGAPFATVVAT